jgi:hypothetical protein
MAIQEQQLFVEDPGPDTEPYPSNSPSEREVFTTPSDPDVETLVKRISEGSLVLRPKFQRGSVWDAARKSRLIESLLLNLPIPPVFFAEDVDGNRIVVDGQQRLIAIDDFYHGRFPLTGLQVLSSLNNQYWKDLPSKLDRKILQRVIRTLVISHHTPPDIQFEIFERLNTGGVPLTEQEIRNATLSGSFNDLLDELAHDPIFLAAIKRSEPDPRLRHHELILRFFALYELLPHYETPLKHYLTVFMRQKRKAAPEAIDTLRQVFLASIKACVQSFGENPFRRAKVDDGIPVGYESVVNRAVFDIQMLGFAGVDFEAVKSLGSAISDEFIQLSLTDLPFVESLSRATDHRSRLSGRLRTWFTKLTELGLHIPLATRLPPV